MKFYKYFRNVLIHKYYVFVSGLCIGVPIWQLLIHDLSKFSWVEIDGYSNWLFGEKSLEKWSLAWLHHLQRNPHHPEHWVLTWLGDPKFYGAISDEVTKHIVVLPIPDKYILEMIADLMGASKLHTGSYAIQEWWWKNSSDMKLHSETREKLNRIISERP